MAVNGFGIVRENGLGQYGDRKKDEIGLLPVPADLEREFLEMIRGGRLSGVRSVRLDLVEDWIDQGRSAELICRSLSAFNRLVIQIVLNVHAEIYPWLRKTTFLEFGSGGRDEQTLGSDQDNGLLMDDTLSVPEEELDDATHDIVVALDGAGIMLCSGNVMISNPVWRGHFALWQRRMVNWLGNPHEKGPWQSGLILDFKPIYGAHKPAFQLRESMWSYVRAHPVALRMMVDELTDYSLPLSFFGLFVTERTGRWAGHINIKTSVLAHMTNCARILCLKHDISCRNTCDRLRALRLAGHVGTELGDSLLVGWEWLQSKRLRIGLHRLRNGLFPHEWVLPSTLSRQEKTIFRSVIQSVEQFVRLVQAGAGL